MKVEFFLIYKVVAFTLLAQMAVAHGSSATSPTTSPVPTASAAPKDVELTLGPDDTKCSVDTDCAVIEKGCCRGEKPIAVNNFQILKLKRKEMSDCRKLELDFKKTSKTRLCAGRETRSHGPQLKATCKEQKCVLP